MADVLIAGAGPTGMAAALLLHERGVRARVFDRSAAPSERSKALAVNPRTLHILEASGVSAAIMAAGRPVAAMTMRRAGRTVIRVPLHDVDPDHPMTVIPQAETERLLAEALDARGLAVERGTEVEFVSQDDRAVRVRLKRDGGVEEVEAPLLLAAQGARSDIRQALGVGFPGDVLPETWDLADVTYAASAPGPDAFIDLAPQGFVFAMAFDAAKTRWRYICSYGDVLEHRGADAPPIQDVPWRSSFKVSHRLAERLAVGRVALAGDSAHLHSPIGARGLNLGVEDACVFAACAADALKAGTADRIADYGRLRHAADGGVVKRVEFLTEAARGRGAYGLLRRVLPPLAAALPPARAQIRNIAVGLDHPVRLS